MQPLKQQVQPRCGYTLIELMIVIAIVALLLLTVLPSYQTQLVRAGRTAAHSELLQVVARQELYYVENRQYASTLAQLGYPSDPYAIAAGGEWLAVDASERIYRIVLSMDGDDNAVSGFSVSAVPQLSQARDTRCGVLKIDSLGVKASAGSHSDCW